MKILAFLQNQWFKEPERVQEIYARSPEHRQDFNARFLFYRSLTGKRIQKAFGELIHKIIWENASPKIGGRSGAKFKADIDHMYKIIEQEHPDVILAFGMVASQALIDMKEDHDATKEFKLICGPHPAARYPVMDELKKMKRKLQRMMRRNYES